MQANGIIKNIKAWEINEYSSKPTTLVGTLVTIQFERVVRDATGEEIPHTVSVQVPFVFPESAQYEIGQELVIEAYPAPPADPDEDRDVFDQSGAYEATPWDVDAWDEEVVDDESSDQETPDRARW